MDNPRTEEYCLYLRVGAMTLRTRASYTAKFGSIKCYIGLDNEPITFDLSKKARSGPMRTSLQGDLPMIEFHQTSGTAWLVHPSTVLPNEYIRLVDMKDV